jgi:diguanylate cyclase (GGDEF)-like protein
MAASPARSFNSRRELTLHAKLTAALALVLALFVTIGPLGLFQLHAITGMVREIREAHLPQVLALERIRHLASDHAQLAIRQPSASDGRLTAAVTNSLQETENAIAAAEAAYVAAFDDRGDDGQFSAFRSQWAAYIAALRATEDRQAAGDATVAGRLTNAEIRVAADRALALLDRLVASSKNRILGAAVRADGIGRLALVLAFAGTILAVVVTVATIVWAHRRINAPLREISRAMRLLVAGDETVAITNDPGRNDEIGVLIGAASKFRSALICSREFAAVAEQQRERLEAAVSNMPVGLSMFDDAERLIICNSAYCGMYGLSWELARPGTALADIVEGCTALAPGSSAALGDYRAAISMSSSSNQSVLRLIETSDRRTISYAVRAMEGGGWIAIHEDVTERRRAEEQIAHMARHDALTDLPNRILFKDRIDEALKRMPRGENVAVISLDLDHFKDINDTLGHPIGDRLLTRVATRLKECVRDADTVARFGGDEFAVVQVGSRQPEAAVALAHRIIDAVSAPYDIDGQRIVIGVSAGLAVAPGDGVEPEVLIKNSDLALYSAKAEDRGTFKFFNPDMDARMQARRRLELELRQAVEEEQFELYYQPVIDLDRDEVMSFEALLRWRHPERGLVMPGEFIPFAEEIGLIIPMGAWVLRRACCDAVAWPDRITVAVNLSPVQFKNPRLLNEVITALAASGLPANRLELEITESVLLVNTDATLALLHRLHDFGVHIAMDDFGTGYSSLSYLRKFPFDRIKIDGSFIGSDDVSSLAVIRAVAGLGTNLAMATTAEGVETQQQLDRVRVEGINAVQGYLLARPCPFAETADLLVSLAERNRPAA